MKKIALAIMAILLFGLAPSPFAQAPTPALEKSETSVRKAEMIIMGREVEVKENEIAAGLVVINGTAKIKGTVENDLIVVGGSAKIDGRIEGQLIVIGEAELGPKAQIRGDSFVIGGRMMADPGANISGQRCEITLGHLGALLGWTTDWVTEGLLLMRPFPHNCYWAWIVAGGLLFLYLVLAVLFRRPVEASSDNLRAKTIYSFLIGLLAFILFGPLVVILVSSVVGIMVVPFVVCGFIAALLLGKVVFYHAVGRQCGQQLNAVILEHPLAAILVGAGVFDLFFMVPVLGFIIWGVTLPIGLGALLLTAGQNVLPPRPKPSAHLGSPLDNPVTPAPEYTDLAATPPPLSSLTLPRAGFWVRTGATLIDLIIVGVLTIVLVMPHFSLVLWAIYHVALWAWQGTTLGGLIFGLKIVRLDGRPIDFGVAVARSLACVLSALPLLLGFFWVGWDPEKQSWHDRITSTLIVRSGKGLAHVPATRSPLPAMPEVKPAPETH